MKKIAPNQQYDLYQDPSSKQRRVSARDLPKPHIFLRRRMPTPTPVFATYWDFAKRRQDIYFSRLFGSMRSLEENYVLRHFRFTNAYRSSDRVSQYLIRHVLYDQSWSNTDLFFRLLIFKFFNKIETWEALQSSLGPVSWSNYSFKEYDHCLSQIMSKGGRIYSAAYIMPSGITIYGYKRKHRNHLKIIESMISSRAPDRIAQLPDFKSVYLFLREYPCVGPFVGYQLAIDLNYSALLNFSENDFVEPGPGALDGIAKCFSDLGDYSPADIIRYVTDIQDEAFSIFAPEFQTLWGRKLHLIDCQNLFCEVSKYARVVHPDIEGLSKRTRIKQAYKASNRPVERPWFPPKWRLNEAIECDPRWNT